MDVEIQKNTYTIDHQKFCVDAICNFITYVISPMIIKWYPLYQLIIIEEITLINLQNIINNVIMTTNNVLITYLVTRNSCSLHYYYYYYVLNMRNLF